MMECQRCFSRFDGGLCQSVTCVRNRQAEADRQSRRGVIGKTSSKEEPEKAPIYHNPPLASEGSGLDVKVIRTKHVE